MSVCAPFVLFIFNEFPLKIPHDFMRVTGG